MNRYRIITGGIFDLTVLSPKEKKIFEKFIKEYAHCPDWESYSIYWQKKLKPILESLDPKDKVKHPLYKIGQDLEMRLGIAQGMISEPDYRDYLIDHIERKFGSRYSFCKKTGIPEAFLSQVLSGKKDFSVQMLRRAAEALGLKLALLPKKSLIGNEVIKGS